MINKTMIEEQPQNEKKEDVIDHNEPNEKVGFFYSSSLKITETDSGKILLQMRCD
jgi:hypothetical protein